MASVTVALVTCLFLAGKALAYPSGAPTFVCETMAPNAAAHGAPPQTSPPPYWISVTPENISPGERVSVTIMGPGGSNIRGILLQAIHPNTSEMIAGRFEEPMNSDDFKHLGCGGSEGSAITHRNRNDKALPVSFTWVAPSDFEEGVFKATIVETQAMYWLGIKSDTVTSNDDEEEEEDTCSVTQMWRAAACAANLNNYINESLQHMNNGDLDIFTFCDELQVRHDDFFMCSILLINDCQSVFEQTIQLFNNTNSWYCECNMNVNCVVDPCSISEPPQCPGAYGARCISNYCAGCWAIWVDEEDEPIRCGSYTTVRPSVYPPSSAVRSGIKKELLFGAGIVWILSLWIQ